MSKSRVFFQKSRQTWCICNINMTRWLSIRDTNIWNQSWAEPGLRSLAEFGPMRHRLWERAPAAGHSAPSSAAQTPTPRWSTAAAIRPSVSNARQRKQTLTVFHFSIEILPLRVLGGTQVCASCYSTHLSVCPQFVLYELLSENSIMSDGFEGLVAHL